MSSLSQTGHKLDMSRKRQELGYNRGQEICKKEIRNKVMTSFMYRVATGGGKPKAHSGWSGGGS